MKKVSIVLFSLVSLLVASSSFASTKCGYLTVKSLTIQADRENGSLYANTLRISVADGVCADIKWAYISNTHSAYEGILTALLQGGKFYIWVQDSLGIYPNAREIEWITK